MEAMAMGTPVLATAIGGVTELIEDGVNGRLLDPHDPAAWAQAIRELAADGDQCVRLAARGRASTAVFAPDAIAREVVRVYEEVYAQHGRR
jgi:D-inositol-3-phosphate glycosyltransferase